MSSHSRDVDKDPVACIEVELGGTLDHQSGHIRGKDHPCLDNGCPTAKVDVHCPYRLVDEPSSEWSHNPEPTLRGVKDYERKVEPVEQVTEVEDLKEASAADERGGSKRR